MTARTTEQMLREETVAIHGEECIAEILATIPGNRDFHEVSGKELYRVLNHLNASALCLSGGGIRSAAFALGAIEALAAHPRSVDGGAVGEAKDCLLTKFHYLSTVSGGGYIGSWLSAWVAREATYRKGNFSQVWEKLIDKRKTPEKEPEEITWLREFSNYLTPKLGLLSADTWTAVALYWRNLLLNWLIILPVICAAILIIKLCAVLGFALVDANDELLIGIAAVGLIAIVWTLVFVTVNRPSREQVAAARVTTEAAGRALEDEAHNAAPGAGQVQFLWLNLVPAFISAIAFTQLLAADLTPSSDVGSVWPSLIWGAGAGVLIYAAGWLLALLWKGAGERETGYLFKDLVAWIVAGAVYGALLGFGAYLYLTYDLKLLLGGLSVSSSKTLVLFVYGVPWIITAQLTAEMIFVGLTSWQDRSDSDREWFGRSTGWFGVAALAWFVVAFLILIGADLAFQFYAGIQTAISKTWSGLLTAVAAGAGLITALIGKSSVSPAQGQLQTRAGMSANVVLAITTPIFLISLIIGLSALLDELLLGHSLLESPLMKSYVSTAAGEHGGDLCWLFIGLVIALVIGAGASSFVNINRFSLHALYRNRLIRAFLGASNPKRRANPFTGFDENDSLRMHELWPKKPDEIWRPFHVVNIALNVVSSKRLAWQERKAEPFTVSPLHSGTGRAPVDGAGAPQPSYRPSKEYGHEKEGISLGTAMAISGAAASPNMGYNSSPLVTLVLALFNVRLGWWLGNPIRTRGKSYQQQAPRFALLPLISEMFGLTTDEKAYVYLSDGGHFENLGLYEMVRRRCRFIIVSDAGADPKFEFEDLGNAVRKIWLDLGVAITFKGLNNLKMRADKDAKGTYEPPFHALGTICYAAADGSADGSRAPKDGIILYLKAAYHSHRLENVGIRSYALANPRFPHEPTGDQFFSESQFESYRVLGFNTVDEVLKQAFSGANRPRAWSMEEIFGAINKTLAEPTSVVQ